MTSLSRFTVATALLAIPTFAGAAPLASQGSPADRATSAPSSSIEIVTLSTRPDRVSGGGVLLRVVLPATSGEGRAPTVTLNHRDVSDAFRPDGDPGSFTALLTGLALGQNEVTVVGGPFDLPDSTLHLTNYATSGPIVSGPHIEPFICQTEDFTLPDGTSLGPPLDENCRVQTRVQHIYRSSTESTFHPFPEGASLPDDLAMTTTTDGRRVPFIVRVETGTMNRGIYQNLVLHDPRTDPDPSPIARLPGWNGRLIAVHGVGCPTGWYRQGSAMGVNPLTGENVLRLGEGYAIFTNTLNHPTNSCNAFLAGETTMMGKEHFIETFGMPSFTVSIGTSGGAYTGLQVADAFPGLIDGVIARSTFPDALSIAVAGLDAHLLTRYLTVTDPDRFTDDQIVAITGYSSVQAFIDAANQAQRTDPVPGREDIDGYDSARWHGAVPVGLRYHPETHPAGARPTVFDVARNVYGVDPETGYALRPFDNVGVQYGLAALNEGAISVEEFLDLNERIGGYDHDANYVPERSVGDEGAIRRAYQSGVTLGGGGGLARIPVMDAGGYNEATRYHYQWFHFAVRERMRLSNGAAENHVMWRGSVPADETWEVMMEWLTAIHEQGEGSRSADATLRAKPARASDGCWISSGQGSAARFVKEPQTFSDQPDSTCNEQFPSYAFVRHAAGGPLHGNTLKCRLEPIDPADYAVPFSRTELDRLRRIFPQGVCDWSQPGVAQTGVVPWASVGPAPENLIHDAFAP